MGDSGYRKGVKERNESVQRPHYFFTWSIIKLHNCATFKEETLLLTLENNSFPLLTELGNFSRSFHAHQAEIFFLSPPKMFYREEKKMSILKLAEGQEEEKTRYHMGVLRKYVSQISCQEVAAPPLKKFLELSWNVTKKKADKFVAFSRGLLCANIEKIPPRFLHGSLQQGHYLIFLWTLVFFITNSNSSHPCHTHSAFTQPDLYFLLQAFPGYPGLIHLSFL